MMARSGALPPLTRTGSWDSKSFAPSYEILMPVQSLNSFQDFWSESDSGLMIEANIVTVLPDCPANAWYLAQSPLSAGPGPAWLLLEVFEQPANAVATTRAGPTSANARRRVSALIDGPPRRRGVLP